MHLKDALAKNISRYRKEKGLTQDKLANLIGVSFQAVSKWETAQTMPDVAILPKLSKIFNISIDKLLGYNVTLKPITIYEEQYKNDNYYWGVIPSKMCLKVLELMPPTKHLKLLDIGCGEGKNAVFFARNGYDVTAFDISSLGIEKTKRLAEEAGVHVNVFKADIMDFRLDTDYDILFSSGVLHYLKPELREEIITNYKRYTTQKGLHAFNVFVEKPFIRKAPDHEETACKWISGELLNHYHDWYIEESQEVVFECHSSGIPHKHAMNKLIARKIKEGLT